MGRLPYDVVTLKQFLQLPEIRPAFEFIDGRVIQKASGTLSKSILRTELVTALNAFAGPRKLGKAHFGPRCTFAGQSLVFDVAYYLPGRLPKITRRAECPQILIPPDIAAEVLSPRQSVRELDRKLELALGHDSSLGWLIRPGHEDVWVYRPGRDPKILRAGDILTGDPVLPGFSLPIAELFGWLDSD